MHISNETLLIIVLVGIVAGWLAGRIVQGTGFGIGGDLVVGVLGAFIGSWLLPALGIHFASGLIAAIVSATVGAVALLLIIRLIRGGSGWHGLSGR
jgi:uncharacterized membrane protein YeaQ/YmgE (transglycosylase-associated protein family)